MLIGDSRLAGSLASSTLRAHHPPASARGCIAEHMWASKASNIHIGTPPSCEISKTRCRSPLHFWFSLTDVVHGTRISLFSMLGTLIARNIAQDYGSDRYACRGAAGPGSSTMYSTWVSLLRGRACAELQYALYRLNFEVVLVLPIRKSNACDWLGPPASVRQQSYELSCHHPSAASWDMESLSRAARVRPKVGVTSVDLAISGWTRSSKVAWGRVRTCSWTHASFGPGGVRCVWVFGYRVQEG